MADLDPDKLNKLRVVDLREELSNRGLPTAGLKADLVKRLRDALLEENIDRGGGDEEESMDAESTDSSKDNDAEQVRIKEEQREEEEQKFADEQRKAEELRLIEDLRLAEECRLAEESQKAEMKRLAEEKQQAEMKRLAEEKRQAELKRLAEEKRQAELKRLAEEKQQVEIKRLAEEKRQAELKRLAEEKQQAEMKRLAEEKQQAEMKRLAEEKRQAEIKRLAEEKRQVEIKRLAEEKRKADEKRMEDELQRTEKKRLIEEERKAEERRLMVEKKRLAEKKIEEERKISEQKRRAEEELAEQKRSAQERRLLEQKHFEIELEKMAENNRIAEEKKREQLEKDRQLAEALKHVKLEKLSAEEQQKQFQEEQQRLFEEELKSKGQQKPPDGSSISKRGPPPTPASIISQEKQMQKTEPMDTNVSKVIKLPQALEKVLAFKTIRAHELGVDDLDNTIQKSVTMKTAPPQKINEDDDEYLEIEEDTVSNSRDSKNRRRKKKKKKNRASQLQEKENKGSEVSKSDVVDVDVEYVQEVISITDPMYMQFMRIFDRFKLTDPEKDKEAENAKEEPAPPVTLRKKPADLDDEDDDDDDDDKDEKMDDDKPKLSKRKLKKLSRMSVAELKQKVSRPELVEMHDVTAKDPVLLLHLKASRNTVPVPRHWCFKRKYLQGKRGIEKPAFELPDFIKRTGIMEMRQALQEKEDQKTLKAKMRERVRPKMGKIDIDYQKLHDAFFKWQTKPKMTIHGDLYYEGKEFETRLKEKKPGDLSEDLRTALGMPTGPNANKCPPPWLIAMQRYGPPPSYPNLKIPGLNAPIPDSCSFGYHAGGWGKPPVDETGKPLYGDVFGVQLSDSMPNMQEEELDHTLWGELESESSESEEEEEEESGEEEDEDKMEDDSGLVTPAEGLITPSGFSSIPAGMETPDMIELRKRKIESEMEGGDTPALYTILPEKKTERVGQAMMGSTHVYDLAGAIAAGGRPKAPGAPPIAPQGVEVALDPSELELDTAAMAARYEQTVREQQSQLEKEDLSDMVAEHAARQKNKRKKQQVDSTKPPKKYKEFKF